MITLLPMSPSSYMYMFIILDMHDYNEDIEPRNTIYSGTSNKGPTEKGTDNLSTKDTSNIPKSVYAIHFNLRKEDNLSTRDKMAGPKVSLTRRFHCTDKTTIFLYTLYSGTSLFQPCRDQQKCLDRQGGWISELVLMSKSI